MRQLTAVDSQFLEMEDPRNLGHVGFLAVVDPSTAPDGKVDREQVDDRPLIGGLHDALENYAAPAAPADR